MKIRDDEHGEGKQIAGADAVAVADPHTVPCVWAWA